MARQLFCFQNITKSVILGIDILYLLLFLYRIVPKECALYSQYIPLISSPLTLTGYLRCNSLAMAFSRNQLQFIKSSAEQ